jgi:PAS domain S-box-containing protein
MAPRCLGMADPPRPGDVLALRGRVVAAALAGLGLAYGLAVLAGWLAGIAWLQAPLPGHPPMKAGNALALVLACGAVLAGLSPRRAWRWASMGLAIGAIAVGIAAIVASALAPAPLAPPPLPPPPPQGLPPGAPPPEPPVPPPQQPTTAPGDLMSELGGACYILLGLAIVVGRAESHRLRAAADTVTLAVGLIAIYVIGAFVYGAPDLAQSARLPFPAAATLLLVALAHILARPQAPAGHLMLSPGPEGRLARRLLPAIVAIPLLLGDLRLRAEDAGLFTTEQGAALYAFAVVVLLGAVAAVVLAGVRREHRAAARAQERFARVFEASPVGIALSRPDGRLVDANPALARILGRPREELRQAGAGSAAWWPDPAGREAQLAAAVSGGRTGSTATLQAADGASRVVEVTGELVDVGGETLLLSLVNDVTERERAREDRERRLAVEAELDRTRRLDAFRTEFINHTAHELNTPLMPVMLQMHVLEASLSKATPAQRKAFDTVSRGLARLGEVVRDVVEAARAQSGQMLLDRQRVDLGAELAAAVESHRAAAERNGLRLEVEAGASGGPVVAEADAGKLRLAFGHLLGNALKFTPRGGTVRAGVGRVGESGHGGEDGGQPGDAVVWVEDDGIGLDPARMDRLWRPYSQLHDKGEVTALGAGLGLYVTRAIVEQHGGQVGASSPGPGKGSRFWLTLPGGN